MAPSSIGATLTTDESITSAGSMFRERWEYVARDSLHDVTRWAELAELELLGHLGADVVVTIDRTILSLRNHALLRGLNVMTPEEAFVLVGVWSRVVHNAFCEGAVGYNNGLYYWAQLGGAHIRGRGRRLRALTRAPRSADPHRPNGPRRTRLVKAWVGCLAEQPRASPASLP
jgi:hypothetical protein